MRRLVLAIALLAGSRGAEAYVDPNAGGLLFQVLTPLLIAVAATWTWIRRGVSRIVERARGWLARH